MCGITFTTLPIRNINALKHRGPDSTTYKTLEYHKYEITMLFQRLAITGRDHAGDQPFYDDEVYVLCNGEIYNYKSLITQLSLKCVSNSDCEVILRMYLKTRDTSLLCHLNGEFAFVIFDMRLGHVIYARDLYGVRPLFVNITSGGISLSSELKGMPNTTGLQVSPGMYHTYSFLTNESREAKMEDTSTEVSIKRALIDAVNTRLQTDLEVGFLLSGGLDSSLILSIASEIIPVSKIISVFTIGFSEDAPDVINARKVIKYLGDKYGKRYAHHVVIVDILEGINTIPLVIKSIESYDTTTVRASTPMWLLGKYITDNTNIKVLLSGEGSDEINGSYLYFNYAPDASSFEIERRRLLSEIHLYDGLRADRCMSAHSLELRVPFLDKNVVHAHMTNDKIYTSFKDTGMEKYHLRQQFIGYLPDDVLMRTKAAFSDAVGEDWRKTLVSHIDTLAVNGTIKSTVFEYLSPKSNEEMCYRTLFEGFYPGQGRVIPGLWLPRWVNTDGEPSATVLRVYKT